MVSVAEALVQKSSARQPIFVSSICAVPCLKGKQKMTLPAPASHWSNGSTFIVHHDAETTEQVFIFIIFSLLEAKQFALASKQNVCPDLTTHARVVFLDSIYFISFVSFFA